MTIMFSLDSNLEFYFNHEINVSPTVPKFPKLPKWILFVEKHVFNRQIRKNSMYVHNKNSYYLEVPT
jgi:hypothetical protein